MTIKKLETKELCLMAMLLSITVVLSYFSGYLRIGTSIKFSISFISVYMAGALFGCLAGGFIGATADIISCFVNPVGPLIWQLTIIEFIYGFSFGIFKKEHENKWISVIKVLICGLFQFLVNLFIKTKILINVGYMPENYKVSLGIRFPGALIMCFLMIFMLLTAELFYMNKVRESVKK